MKNTAFCIVVAVIIGGAVGLFVGRAIFMKPSLRLKVVDSSGGQHIIVYNYYLSDAGEEIKHGRYYETANNGRVIVDVEYSGGLISKGSGKFN